MELRYQSVGEDSPPPPPPPPFPGADEDWLPSGFTLDLWIPVGLRYLSADEDAPSPPPVLAGDDWLPSVPQAIVWWLSAVAHEQAEELASPPSAGAGISTTLAPVTVLRPLSLSFDVEDPWVPESVPLGLPGDEDWSLPAVEMSQVSVVTVFLADEPYRGPTLEDEPGPALTTAPALPPWPVRTAIADEQLPGTQPPTFGLEEDALRVFPPTVTTWSPFAFTATEQLLAIPPQQFGLDEEDDWQPPVGRHPWTPSLFLADELRFSPPPPPLGVVEDGLWQYPARALVWKAAPALEDDLLGQTAAPTLDEPGPALAILARSLAVLPTAVLADETLAIAVPAAIDEATWLPEGRSAVRILSWPPPAAEDDLPPQAPPTPFWLDEGQEIGTALPPFAWWCPIRYGQGDADAVGVFTLIGETFLLWALPETVLEWSEPRFVGRWAEPAVTLEWGV